MRKTKLIISLMVVCSIFAATISACSLKNDTAGENLQNPDLLRTSAFEAALLTATYAYGQENNAFTQTPFPTSPLAAVTETPQPEDTPTSPVLVPTYSGERPDLDLFNTNILDPGEESVQYFDDNCQYLELRWNQDNSEPGTVVVPVMFHSIKSNGNEAAETMDITQADFISLMDTAHAYDFEVITMDQMLDFVYSNGKIPPRSLLIIVDDRKFAEYFRDHFKPYYDQFGWTVVNAFISKPDNTQELWDENADLEFEGWVNHQAHGVIHNIPFDTSLDTYDTSAFGGPGILSAEDYILNEMEGSIKAFEEHFNKKPVAYIWAGGGYTSQAIEIGRELGYQIGFTAKEIGPVMFNWVTVDEQAKSMEDPLMVIPRYWSRWVSYRLIDEVIEIQSQAIAYAEQNKQLEYEWYQTYCAGYPSLP